MAWNYDPTKLQTSVKDQARFLIGDTVSTDPQLEDEEINFALRVRGSIWGAAALGCAAIASNLSRRADTTTGELRTLYSSQARAYAARAAMYENQAASRSGSLPYAGGISVQDKISNQGNPDRVAPNFNVGMTDNMNQPIAPAGNESSIPTGPANGQGVV